MPARPKPVSPRSVASPRDEAFKMACFVFCVAQVVYLAAAFALHQWLIDAEGRGIPTDFVNVWAAGKLALLGYPDWAYIWKVHKEIENAAVGYTFAGYYGWHYPPPFLFVASLLALLPYALAYAAWVAVTLPGYLVAIRAIVGEKIGWLVAFAFPSVLSNAMVGQNGFFPASLIGGTLYFMEKRPVWSGVCLGLLTYKPQFGVLFPLALIAARRWQVFAVAAAVALAMAGAATLAFGVASWQAFVHWLPITSQTFLSEGQASFGKLQSLYGLVRSAGGAVRRNVFGLLPIDGLAVVKLIAALFDVALAAGIAAIAYRVRGSVLVAAFAGLKVDSPFGPFVYRASDHQATMGAYVGQIEAKGGKGVMVNWRYVDGKDALPPDDEVKKMRPAN